MALAMEVNEAITVVELDMKKDQLSDEGRQAQWPCGKFFQSVCAKRHLSLSIISEKNTWELAIKPPQRGSTIPRDHDSARGILTIFQGAFFTLCFGRP